MEQKETIERPAEYDPNSNYCGSKNMPKIINQLIPDVMFGVNMGYSCYQHSLGWTEAEKTHDYKVHDLKLKKNIQEDFMGTPVLTISVNGWKIKLPDVVKAPLAKAVSNIFYVGARMSRILVTIKPLMKKIKDLNHKP